MNRRYLGAWVRRWWGELLCALAWIGLLWIAQFTHRERELFGGSAAILLVLGTLHWLGGVRTAARQQERDLAAELVLAVSVPRGTPAHVAEQLEAFRARIATAIRAQGAHLREVRHG